MNKALLLSIGLVASVLMAAAGFAAPTNRCELAAPCEAEGVLELSRHGGGAVGVIYNGESCIALALSDAVFLESSKWSKHRVRVSGTGYRQPNVGMITWLHAGDRKVSAHYCDVGVVIYVEKIDLAGRRSPD
jgi:hypothetical protein